MMGSCRGSCQLTRLKMYGLSSVSKHRSLVQGRTSRYSDCHGGSSYAIKDVLDELVASLHPCAKLIGRHLVWNNGLQELQELGGALNRVCDLGSARISPCLLDTPTAGWQYAGLTPQR